MVENGVIAEADQAKLTEEQKAQVDEYVAKGYNLIYDEDEAVATMASRNPDTKVKDVASAGFLVGQKIDRSMEQAGRAPYPDTVKVIGGYHLVDKIIEFSEHKGNPPFSPEEKKSALEETYKKYISSGIEKRTIDPIKLANDVERAQPGAIKEAMSKIPDNISTNRTQPSQPQPKGQVGATPPERKGLLSQPSPLEDFLNEQRK